LRTVYLGTSEFAAVVLDALAGSAHRPVLVVTRPDRPAGRGRKLTPPPVALRAAELGLELAQPSSVNSDASMAEIASFEPDAVCVCAFGALIKEPLLSAWPMLNVHPSLLPRWRGAAPVERAIMAGDAQTGVSIMQVTAGLDSGPVSLQERIFTTAGDTYGSLAARLQDIGGALLVRALDESPPFVQQPSEGVTYAEKITAEDRRLYPELGAEACERVVRALSPHIGATVALADGSLLGVAAASVVCGDGVAFGEVSLDGLVPVLGCAGGAGLALDLVKPAGKREMSGADYVRGHRR
jgi:methionyl-tRNA formyltransferase